MDGFLFQAMIYLGAAVIAVPLASRLGLGSVLGYLAAGILIGPVTGLVGSETQDLQHFAELGVVMMLFLIGLELEPRALWDMRHRLVGLGGLQIGVSAALIMVASLFLGLAWQTALAVGFIFALSSTAIVLQTLSEKGLMQTNGGRSIFSVLLTQDIAVIPLLAFLPLLTLGAAVSLAPDGSIQRSALEDDHHAYTIVEGLPAWGVTLVTIGAVAIVVIVGIYLTRPVFRYIHHARLREMYTALALLMVVATAVLMSLVGLSPALGTFLAGMVLANSEFRHELESDLAPFKGLLLGLFFITVGAGINFGLLLAQPMKILGLTLGVLVIKGAVLFGLAILFNIRGKDRWLFTLGLAQAGEFGFVLISFSLQQGVLDQGLAQRLLLIVALSMLITPLLFIAYDVLSKRAQGHGSEEEDEIDRQAPIIIAGIGRFGQIVNRLVRTSGFSTVVIDNDLGAVQMMREFGFRAFFGDPTRPDLLTAAGLETAQVLVVAIDSKEDTNRLVAYARKSRPDLHIIARAADRLHVYELYGAGADDIVRETFDSSLRAGRYVLENLGLSEYEAGEAEMLFYHHDRNATRELAKLWKPGVPVTENAAYVARAKELNAEVELAFASRVQQEEDKKLKAARRPGDRSKGKT